MAHMYERLYRLYAFPDMKYLESEQQEILDKLIEILAIPKDQRLDVLDLIQTLRLEWGLESFVLGLRLGEGIAAPYEGLDLRQCLLDLLAKLDQPVP